MFIYRSLPSEVTRKYKTAQGVIRRIKLDFPVDKYVFYVETETKPNMEWQWTMVPAPTSGDLRCAAECGVVLRRKVFFNYYQYVGWQLHGSEITIRWVDE